MKKIIFYIIPILTIFLFESCGKKNDITNIDTKPPSAPTGLYVVNGDNVVDLSWNPNPENDVEGYYVYYAYSYNGKYTRIGSTQNTYYTDYDASNGTKYYYAVSAYDYNGNESDLSIENVSATPRPEGFNENIFDYNQYPDQAGFSFYSYTMVPYNSDTTDFYFEIYNGTTPYIDVYGPTDIEDMGATTDIYDIPYAPSSGWSPTHDAVAIVGHTYVIHTSDNYYGKIRVSRITNDRMYFDWAFQTVKGNTQLKISNVPNTRSKYIKSAVHKN